MASPLPRSSNPVSLFPTSSSSNCLHFKSRNFESDGYFPTFFVFYIGEWWFRAGVGRNCEQYAVSVKKIEVPELLSFFFLCSSGFAFVRAFVFVVP